MNSLIIILLYAVACLYVMRWENRHSRKNIRRFIFRSKKKGRGTNFDN